MNIIDTFLYYQNILRWIACITFFAAFVLTLWPNTSRTRCAAVLFGVGLFASLLHLAIYYFSFVKAGSNGEPTDVHPTACLVIGIWVLFYALAAVWLLSPSISQQKAIRFGKILHLVILPPLVLWLTVGWVEHHMTLGPYNLAWLVYALLWFRIREAYASKA
jgi:hypothetical protein